MTRVVEPGTNQPATSRAPRRATQLEHESNYPRLSRFPDRYNPKPTPLQDHPDDLTPFATNYFKQNPDAQDLGTPEEKLESLNGSLGGSLSTPQRFTYLTQKKTMVYLIHGDESPEMFECLTLLGFFYAENDRPESAIRHLQQAQRLEKQIEISEDDSRSLSLVLAECHLKVDTKKAQHLAAAETAIQRFGDDEPEEADLKTRLALVRARILKEKGNAEPASEQYEIALNGLTERDEQTGKVYVEAAEVYESQKKYALAKEMYQTSRGIFAELEMNDIVSGLDAKIRKLDEMMEQEEEQPGEEEQGNETEEGDEGE
jgi:tetratricopeptide (TPR) repeat protein